MGNFFNSALLCSMANNGIVATGLYSTPKDSFLESRYQLISKMKEKIANLEQEKKDMQKESFTYQKCEKKIEKCKSIIKDCEQLIFVTKVQMNLHTNARFRSL